MIGLRRKQGFPVEISHDEVVRLLGYGESPLPFRVSRLIDSVEREARSLIRPATVFRRLRGKDLRNSPYLGEIDDAMICLVTIGNALEESVSWHENEGDLSRALILNVFGSAAAESAADAANAMIRETVEKQGLRCSRRFSPGYGGWNVEEQKWLLPALKAEKLGVSLTDGCMMMPRKSVTFAVTVGENPVEMRHENPCDSCDLVSCRYRRESTHLFEKGPEWENESDSNFCPQNKWM